MNVKKVPKNWGYELWLVNNEKENYCSKILHILSGCNTSMHFHALKHETFYIQKGTLLIKIINTQTKEIKEVILNEGDTFELDRLIPHQLIAKNGDVTFLETSTFHRDSDSYKLY